MDKVIFDALVKKGLIAQVGVDYTKYSDAYEMISKGIITYPGARAAVDKLLASLNPTKAVAEPVVTDNTVVKTPVETPVEVEVEPTDTPTEIETEVETPAKEEEEEETEETTVKKTTKKSTKKTE